MHSIISIAYTLFFQINMPAKMLKQEFASYLYSTEHIVRIESFVETVYLETYILIEDGSIDNCI